MQTKKCFWNTIKDKVNREKCCCCCYYEQFIYRKRCIATNTKINTTEIEAITNYIFSHFSFVHIFCLWVGLLITFTMPMIRPIEISVLYFGMQIMHFTLWTIFHSIRMETDPNRWQTSCRNKIWQPKKLHSFLCHRLKHSSNLNSFFQTFFWKLFFHILFSTIFFSEAESISLLLILVHLTLFLIIFFAWYLSIKTNDQNDQLSRLRTWIFQEHQSN